MTKRAFLLFTFTIWICVLFAPSGNTAEAAATLQPRPTIVQKRQEAATRLQIALEERAEREGRPPYAAPLATPGPYPPGLGFNPLVDYSKPNYAYSPNLRKFVNSLPGLGAPGCVVGFPLGTGNCNENNLGQYIPIANPDTTTYSQSDYYEIGIAQYQQRMHSDLPAAGTTLRGYYQINSGTIGATSHDKQYLGPLIIAHRDRAVRLKVRNELGRGAAGDLPLPVDTTVMGSGTGPLGGTELYTQNRATVHLHGGLVPWISDGTPHQWFTPAGDPTSYKKGVSFQNVPDMVAGPGCAASPTSACITPSLSDGIGTFYYPNQQSARLMFFHDHSYGITRLNVYAGERRVIS